MKTSIVTIGDELLLGQILDTNSQWIAKELHQLGVELVESVSVSDSKQAIVNSLDHALSQSDLVIITGGLGPTKDDITKHTLTSYFKDELELDVVVMNRIKAIFDKRNIPFSELNKNQAMLPKKAITLPNLLGTPSGMWFEKEGKIVISLPGVPYEMKGLMLGEVLPRLRKIGGFLYQEYQTYVLYGLGESSAADMLDDFEDILPDFIKLAYLPQPGRLTLRLTGKHQEKVFLQQTIATLGEKLLSVFKDYSIVKGTEDTVALVKKMLIAKQKTLAVAESCTGGAIASYITLESGVSSFFLGGVVAYHANLKRELLGVSDKIIEKHTVVSAEVAKAMARGIQQKTGANYAIATTGNAGPSTDNTDETLGVVYVSIAAENQVFVERFDFGQPREKVIEQAKNKALEMMLKEILKNQ
ncbi:CinA family nicotinamide mononucleotide deamidase-related protein [Ochrovirga pacifica]|uniref:CinA family nicotinamide mononucleotide deamidase-related protein n=1 Tax=Ochrovirga pacifica TaxID=1042376 RepID=UPI000255982B|nr:CinA family nicotinamide mononucleotide deamidase-related protein [Ochrovirga pacifica]